MFGADGLAEMLGELTRAAVTAREPVLTGVEYRAALREALGGAFHPARLLDRAILRRWVVTEIRRRVDVLIRDEVQPDGGRAMAAYDTVDETALLVEAPAFVPPNARAPRDGPRRAENLARVKSAEKKRRMEDALAARIDAGRWVDAVRPEFTNAPLVLRYLDAVQAEPALLHDDHAAADALGLTRAQVENARRRVNRARTMHAARQKLEALFLRPGS